MTQITPNWLDRAISTVAPRMALKRAVARAALSNTRAYEGATGTRRTDSWAARGTSADSDILKALPRLRARARDLEQNNPHARKAASVWRNNLVAWGIEPRPSTQDPEVNRQIKAVWDEWADFADATGQLDINGIQELAVGTMISGGEALVRRDFEAAPGSPLPLQLTVLEGDHLDLSRTGVVNGNRVVQGVQFDARGRRSAYWLYPEHPGNVGLGTGGTAFQSVPVPADGIAHLYRKERSQTRGVPWGSSVILDLKDLADYRVAEIIRKKIESCVVAVVLGAEEGDEGIGATVTDANGVPVETFEPGLFAYAHGGKDVKFSNPSSGGNFAEFERVGLHTVAAGYLVPYELMTTDLSQVNFASSRVGIIEFRRLVQSIQWLCIIPMLLNPIWRWFCQAAWLAGRIPDPVVPVEWDPPEFESINPIDDANTNLIRMRSGEMTLFEVLGKRGLNPRRVLEEHAEVAALLDQLGLILDSDPRRVSRAGLTQVRTEGSVFPEPGDTGAENAEQRDREAQERAQDASRGAPHLRPIQGGES